PFPTELLVVVFGTLISYLAKFNQRFDVQIIGSIKSGIPAPQLPPIFLIKDMIVQCLVIAIIAFAINYSLCDLFSKTHRYKINPTQELFAYGASNIFSSFFSCFVSAGSLGRSLVQNNAGGKSQVSSIFSCIILALVLAFIAPLFQDLPQACLASIILVALQGLLKKIKDLSFYWKINKIEFLQFLITYLSVIILDIDIGLGVGVAFYILVHLVRSSKPYSTLLGNIPGTELYRDLNLYKDAEEIDHIKIVRFQAELHATNSIQFKKAIYKLTETKPQDYIEAKNKLIAKQKKRMEKDKPSKFEKIFPDSVKKKIAKKINEVEEISPEMESLQNRTQDISLQIEIEENKNDLEKLSEICSESPKLKFLIIDCSSITFIDSVGVKVTKQLISDFKEIGIIMHS
ncbi:solute carrier family 26 member 6-like, partial [Brachionus plicatilis]